MYSIVIHQSVRAVQEIRFRNASSLICATDLIKASSKRGWPTSSILGPYETLINNKHGVFVSYPDGLALASRLKLPTEQLRDAMNENISRISIEISKDEAEAIDKEASLIVHIWPSRSLINATNLLAVRRCCRTQLPDLLAGSGIHVIHCGAYRMQGTYISYADGLRLCNALEFSEVRLGHIRNAMREGWLGPGYVQHEPNVDLVAVKSKMAAEKAANGETDVRDHVRLEEFLLPCDKTPSFACSSIEESKKLSRKRGGDNLDDQYYEGLDLEDKEFGFYELSTLLLRAAQTLPVQLLGRSREEDQSASRSCDDGLDHNGFERKPVATRRKLSLTQTRILETVFRRSPRIDVGEQARLAKELGIERGRISVSLFSRVLLSYTNSSCSIEVVREPTVQGPDIRSFGWIRTGLATMAGHCERQWA